MALKVGTPAPDFTLPSTAGGDFNLSRDAAGKPLIIYFYPKDFTPGCTKEACEFRDTFAMFRNVEVDIVGISRDTLESHREFRKAHHLPFHLLADVDGSVAESYQALVPLIRFTRRVTYLLDRNHRIAAVYENLFGAEKHIQTMIEKVKNGTLA